MRATLVASILVLVAGSVLAAAPAHGEVPGWVKGVAGLWSDGQISDNEFLAAIEYLIQNGFISIPGTDVAAPVSPQGEDPAAQNIAIPVIEVVPEAVSVYDVGIKFEEVPHIAGGHAPNVDVILNDIWIIKGMHEMDGGKEQATFLMSFFEGMEEHLAGTITLSEKTRKVKQFLATDDDFAAYIGGVDMDGLVRYSDRHVGDDVFLSGMIHDVTDLPGEDRYRVIILADSINFAIGEPDMVGIEYSGARIRDDDMVRVAGTAAGIETWDVSSTAIEVKAPNSSDGPAPVGVTQIEIPIITPSHIHVLADPYKMNLYELKAAAMNIPYVQFDEYQEFLGGLVVYYRGTVSSVMDDGDFSMNVSTDASEFDRMLVLMDSLSTNIEISRYDDVAVYGIVTDEDDENGTPAVYALHIE